MIAFIGGAGPEGLGLALRLAAAGEKVVSGSRRLERAEAAAWVRERRPSAHVSDAVAGTDVVFVTVRRPRRNASPRTPAQAPPSGGAAHRMPKGG